MIMPSNHYQEERHDEKIVLEAIYESDFACSQKGSEGESIVTITLRPIDIANLCNPSVTSQFVPLHEIRGLQNGPEDIFIILQAQLSKQYPALPPLVEVLDPNKLLSLEQLEELVARLNLQVHKSVHACILYEICKDAQDYFQEVTEDNVQTFNGHVIFEGNGKWRYRRRWEISNASFHAWKDHGEELALQEEEEHQKGTPATMDMGALVEMVSETQQASYSCKCLQFKEWLAESKLRIDDAIERHSTTLHPSLFVGVVPIFRALQEAGMSVVSIENVLRNDLAESFIHKWAEFGQKYGTHMNRNVRPNNGSVSWPLRGGRGSFSFLGDGRRAALGAPFAQPIMAFHGTEQNSVFSIVRDGLVTGGTNGVSVRCGQTYGSGVYCSPNPAISAGYSEDNQIIVCAVLMGRARVVAGRIAMEDRDTSADQGFDSHTDPTGFNEWILFEHNAILPCWVVEFERLGVVGGFELSKNGKIVRSDDVKVHELEKEEMQRKAEFWFGKGVKVLEMAPRDDELTESLVVTENGRYDECRQANR